MHYHDTIYLILAFLGGAVYTWSRGLGAKAIDWIVRRYIIKDVRLLACWLHHKFSHPGRNALACEIGDCVKVTSANMKTR